jgi:hypothetical protein
MFNKRTLEHPNYSVFKMGKMGFEAERLHDLPKNASGTQEVSGHDF